jgi:hypothetical protein
MIGSERLFGRELLDEFSVGLDAVTYRCSTFRTRPCQADHEHDQQVEREPERDRRRKKGRPHMEIGSLCRLQREG